MSLLKILTSGCGFSYGGQERKTWVNVLRSVGIKIVDVGGPAVSNQWILNKAIAELSINSYDHVLIQLSSLGKLDVVMNPERYTELVVNDSVRDFTYKNIWPSSHSVEHHSKASYYRWLQSNELEIEDITCKLLLLKKLYHNITVLQAYDIAWPTESQQLQSLFYNWNDPLYTQYETGKFFEFHQYNEKNNVPCIQYHADLALQLANFLKLPDIYINRIIDINKKIS